MTIDDLYGAGTWDALQSAFAPPPNLKGAVSQFEQVEIPGGVRVVVSWMQDKSELGRAKVDHYPGHIFIPSLWVTDSAQLSGVLTMIVDEGGDFWESIGIQYADAAWVDEAAATAFRLAAAEDIGPRRLRWKAGGRRVGYAAWKRGQGPEPDWHIQLRGAA